MHISELSRTADTRRVGRIIFVLRATGAGEQNFLRAILLSIEL